MRRPLLLALAWHDYRADVRLSACAVLALVAVLAPLLVLFGLKFGLVGSLTERLQQDPAVREVIPLGSGRYSAAFVAELAARPDVAFAVPRTRQIAATAELSSTGQAPLTVEMLPTAAGDPLFVTPAETLAAPVDLQHVVLSESAARKLAVKRGDDVDAAISRQVAGRVETQHIRLHVEALLPLAAFQRDGLFAPLSLLEAAEDYRDGRAVAALQWPAANSSAPVREATARVYPGFRLYARNLDQVEGLRDFFMARGQEVATQAAAIAQVRSLSHNLSVVFWIIAALGLGGAFAAILANTLAAVQRKRRVLAVLRLLGFSTFALLLFVVLQALYSAIFATVLAGVVYNLAETLFNQLFMHAPGEYACRLLPWHYGAAFAAVLACSALAAFLGGWRVAKIEVSEGLRDV